MPGYILSDLALDDLADIRHSISKDRPSAADRMMTGFFQRFEQLGAYPELGTARPEFGDGTLRIYPVGNYVIFYRHVDRDVEIARVLHGARDLDRMFG